MKFKETHTKNHEAIYVGSLKKNPGLTNFFSKLSKREQMTKLYYGLQVSAFMGFLNV